MSLIREDDDAKYVLASIVAVILAWIVFVTFSGCVGALQGGTIGTITTPSYRAVGVQIEDAQSRVIVGASCLLDGAGTGVAVSNGNGSVEFPVVPTTLRATQLSCTAAGFQDFAEHRDLATSANEILAPAVLRPLFPAPPTRQYLLDSHESFQGAVLHTTQFGDLNWWPTAWTSLNADDTAASYAQIASWGDTDITVSASWNYGEAGQPYGTGQLVPNTDYAGNGDWGTFRAKVKDVIQHQAANGQPFVPRIFMEGDNGFSYYMWAMPLIVQALQPQPDDPVDLTPYVKLQMCYDSCVPGWQPKTQVGDAILATRAACPNCVIALEFSSGYSSTGDGDAFWHSDAGRALDEADWEGNYWPPTNWEQYWEILDRWLGPLYHRPAAQVSDSGAPFAAGAPEYYLRNGTPRGSYGVQCFEPFTYQWVRGQLTAAQADDAYRALQALGCPVIDMPTVH